MHRGFGTILKQYLVGSTSAEQSQTAILMACNTYFSEVFQSHMTEPCFMVSGAITTYAAGTTVPVVGPLGTVNSFAFKPINRRELNILLQKNFFYIGLTKAIEKMFFKSVISIDIKPIGSTFPKTIVSGLLKPIARFDEFGKAFQDYMDNTRRATLEEWYATLDIFFEQVWTFIGAVTIDYVGVPVPEGMFNGTITFSGLSLTV
jgi:hypothetical protein